MPTKRKDIKWDEKFYPGPGLEPGPLAFRANALTNWAMQYIVILEFENENEFLHRT